MENMFKTTNVLNWRWIETFLFSIDYSAHIFCVLSCGEDKSQW